MKTYPEGNPPKDEGGRLLPMPCLERVAFDGVVYVIETPEDRADAALPADLRKALASVAKAKDEQAEQDELATAFAEKQAADESAVRKAAFDAFVKSAAGKAIKAKRGK